MKARIMGIGALGARGIARGLPLLIAVVVIVGFSAASARAQQTVSCPPIQQALVKIPEIVTDGKGLLQGTLLLNDEQQRIVVRTPLASAPPGTGTTCVPQFMRAFHAGTTPPPVSGLADPLPGPTLRARVGDMVELTFLNQINPADFGNSIDMDLVSGGSGCDEVSGIYPPQVKVGNDTVPSDTFANCYHGSSTGNIHYHGTHTNPNTTGDNVLIQVRPSNAQQDPNPVTAATYQKPFDEFFSKCAAMLKGHPLAEWPTKWSDLPAAFTDDQKKRLIAYDTQAKQNLWGMDQKALDAGQWPQYYMGAYPYCFQLPKYAATGWPPPGGNTALQMGQSPGTHWYHAHKHGSTYIDVSNGMSGVFIIEGEYDDALNKFYEPYAKVKDWTRSQPIMLVNQLGPTPNMEHPGAGQADKGPNFSVNGQQQPELQMAPGQVQMWRVVNSSPRSAMYLPSLPVGFTWRQLAQDGVQFSPENYEASQDQPINIAAGNRIDLLIKAPASASGQPLAVQILPNVARAEINPLDETKLPAPVTLLWVNVTGTAHDVPLIPKDKIAPLPRYLADITDREIAGHTRTIVFASGPPGGGKPQPEQHTINNMQFSETNHQGWVDIDKVNTAEEWKIVNYTANPAIDHPFHIHINPFQVTEVFDPNQIITVNGQRLYRYVFDPNVKLQNGQCYLDPFQPDTWKPCAADTHAYAPKSSAGLIWWDVFPIPAGRAVTRGGRQILVAGYFKMRSRFVDFPGVWVMHCHILAHEDRGMMTIVAVGVSQQALANVHHH